jgi:hypothetical protein
VLGLLVVAALGSVLLLRGIGDREGGDPAGTAGPSTSAGPAALPAGYTLYKGDGFTVGVPAGWTATPGREGVVDLTEPGAQAGTRRFLRLITVGGGAEALGQLTTAERDFAANPQYAPYQRVRLEAVDYRDYDAADWEFTFGQPRRHVLYRGAVTDGRTFGLYLSVPDSRWEESRAVFQVAADTFRPTPGG